MARYTVKLESHTGTHDVKQSNDINRAAKYAENNAGYGKTTYVVDNETGKRLTAVSQSCLAEYPDSVDPEWYGDK